MEQTETTRMRKVARQIQRDLSELFQIYGMAAYGGALISVTHVRMSPDLSIAKVWFSIFPSEKAADTLKAVQKQSNKIRGDLGNRVAKQLRIVPQLSFFIDDSLDYAAHIEELLKQ